MEVDALTPVAMQDRSEIIGSSDIPTILGVNKWQSPLELWAQKLGLSENKCSEIMEAGTVLESGIAALYAKRYNLELEKNNSIFALADPAWATATPDYIRTTETGEREIIEIKNTNEFMREEWGSKDEPSVPDYAHCQTIWQMGVTGIHQAKVVALIGGFDLQERVVEWDDELFMQMLTIATDFRKLVETKTPPSVRGGDDETIRKLFKEDGLEEIEAHDMRDIFREHAEISQELSILNKQVKELDNKKKDLKAIILMRSKGAKKIIAGEFQATINLIHNKGSITEPYSYSTIKVKQNGTEQ